MSPEAKRREDEATVELVERSAVDMKYHEKVMTRYLPQASTASEVSKSSLRWQTTL